MKCSILGTNGFLSKAIAKQCNTMGYKLDMYGLEKPVGHQYDNYYKVDLMDSDFDCSALLTSNIIIYAIGAGIQSNLKENLSLIYKLNVTVPVCICNKLKTLDYKGTFVTFGSYFEIGETTEEKFFTEEDILKSACPAPNDYTVSKRMLSRFVSEYKHNFIHWHFFLPTIYGSGENPARLIPYVVNSLKNNEELHFTSGNQIRQYIHVSEVAKIVFQAYINKLSSGVYNIEGVETKSIKQIVSDIYMSLGKKMPINSFGSVQRADVGMKYLALDGSKLRTECKYDTNIKILDVIDSYL